MQVLAVKEKVRETKGEAFPAAHQVLIFQGKVCQAIRPSGHETVVAPFKVCCQPEQGVLFLC